MCQGEFRLLVKNNPSVKCEINNDQDGLIPLIFGKDFILTKYS